jgi:hypothetical protein
MSEEIIDQRGDAWIADSDGQYTVVRLERGSTHGTADSSYPRTPVGLSIARARLQYLTRNT